MGRILLTHTEPLDWTQQAPWSAARGGGRNLEADDGQVCYEGGISGGKRDVRDGPTLQRDVGEHQRGNPCNESPMSESFTGGGLEFPPH